MHPNQSLPILVHWQPAKSHEADQSPWLIVASQQEGVGLASLKSALSNDSATLDANSLRDHDIVLLIPAESTLTARVLVPSAKPTHIRAAIPHLIEEWTLTESESLHLSNGERAQDGQVAVVAIDPNYFNHVLDTVESAQINCSAAYTDASLLPHAPNVLTLLIDGQRVLFRWNAEQTGALEIDAFPSFLTALCKHHLFERIDLFHTNKTNLDIIDEIERRIAALIHSVSIQRTAVASLLHFCVEQLETAPPTHINLRQGKFAPQQTQFKHWQRWKPLAIAAGICLVLQIGVNVIAGWRFEKQASDTHEQAVQLYRELFPSDKRIVNLRQQFQNHLNNGTQADQPPFFTLFGRLTQEIQNTASTNPIQLRSLVYDTKTGSLQVELVVPTVPILDDLQKRLSTNTMIAKVTSAQNAEGIVIGRLSLAGKL